MWSLFCFNSTDGTWRWTCLHVRTLPQAVCGLPVHCITNTVCDSSETVFIIAGIGICHQIIKLLKPFQSVVIITLYPTWSHTVQHSRPLQAMRPFSNTAFYFNYLFLQKFLGLLASWTSSIIWYLEQNTVFHEMGLFHPQLKSGDPVDRTIHQGSPVFWDVMMCQWVLGW